MKVTKHVQVKITQNQLSLPVVLDSFENVYKLQEKMSEIMIGFQMKKVQLKNIKMNAPDGDRYKILTKMQSDKVFCDTHMK